MSKLTQAQRDKLRDADFGDPKNREYPILDQDDVDSAAHLIGDAEDPPAVKKRVVAIARRKGLTPPDAWTSGGSESKFTFSVTRFSEDGEYVVREGKVFECGDYPDKDFSLSEAEADEAIAAFNPQPNDLEHRSTILDGKLGVIQEVRRVGKDLIGKVRIPKWLDNIQGAAPMGVSLAFNRSKRIVGNALTLNPRISDAQVAAAFTASADYAPGDAFDFFISFVGRRHSTTDQTDLQAVHDLIVKLGAECHKRDEEANKKDVVATYAGPHIKEKTKMTLRGFLAQLGFGEKPDLDAEVSTAFTQPTQQQTQQTQQTQQQQQAQASSASTAFSTADESLKTEIRTGRESRLATAAKAFFAELRQAGKAVPAQEEAIIAAFCMAARDDARGLPGYIEGLACFSADGALVEGERVKALRAQYKNATPSNFTREMLDNVDAQILFTPSRDGATTPDEMASLLSMSGLGQAALKGLREQK